MSKGPKDTKPKPTDTKPNTVIINRDNLSNFVQEDAPQGNGPKPLRISLRFMCYVFALCSLFWFVATVALLIAYPLLLDTR